MSNGAYLDGKDMLPIASIGTAAGKVLGTELDTLAGVTAGTGAASKALVANSSGNIILPGNLNAPLAKLSVEAAAGFTGGTGTIYKSGVETVGGLIKTSILFDLTGLGSSTTDLDIIGQGAAAAAYMAQILAAISGTILCGRMTCLEVPAGGVADIDLYWATEATGKFDDGIAALTETALITAGGAWTAALTKQIADPVGIANGYLYLCGGAAGTAATYTAGKFLLELFGY